VPLRAHLHPARSVRLVGSAGLLAAVVLCAVSGWGAAPWWAVLVLAAAVALTELSVVHLELGRSRWTLSLTEAAVGAALVLVPGAWAVVAVGVGVAVGQHRGHQPRQRREFVVAQFVTATAVAQTVAGALGGGVLAACAGLAGSWLVHCVLGSVAVSLISRRPLGSLLLTSGPRSALHTAGNCSIGLLAGSLALHAPSGCSACSCRWPCCGRRTSSRAAAARRRGCSPSWPAARRSRPAAAATCRRRSS
jgi:hypothetical protein